MKNKYYHLIFGFLTLLLVSCTNNDNIKKIINGNELTDETLQKYNETQYDFNDYSSQGGLLFIYKDESSTIVSKVVYLFSETGKIKYSFEIIDKSTIFVVVTKSDYNHSIYDGDIEIINQNASKYVIHNMRLYELSDNQIKQIPNEDIITIFSNVSTIN